MAWGELFGLLAMLAALFGMSAVLARRAGVGSAAAPLAALALAELVLLASGLLGVLRPAGLALAVLGLLGGGLEAALAKKKGAACPFAAALANPAAKLFWAAALALAVGLWLLRPEFLNFDEYSFWGTAAKLTCENDALYTVCDTGLPWQMTELAALPLASYFFQLFGAFAPWRAIFAADLLMLAAVAAAAGCAKRARLACPLFLAGLSLPTLVTVAGHTALLNTAWLEFLGDLPAGMLFGGAAAFWLAVRDEGPAARWLTLPVLMLAANVKSNTFVLGLAATGLVALDAVLFAPGGKRGAKGLAARLGFGAACLAAPTAQYLLWNNYIAGLVRQNAAAGGMGDTASASLPAVVVNGVKLLLGLPAESYFEARSDFFWQYGSAMTDAFWHRKVSVFGTGAAVAALTLAVFLAAVLLAADKRARRVLCRLLADARAELRLPIKRLHPGEPRQLSPVSRFLLHRLAAAGAGGAGGQLRFGEAPGVWPGGGTGRGRGVCRGAGDGHRAPVHPAGGGRWRVCRGAQGSDGGEGRERDH